MLVVRLRDGALFAVHHPGAPVRGVWLYRARRWRGRVIVNGRVLWRPADYAEFKVLEPCLVWATNLAEPLGAARRVA